MLCLHEDLSIHEHEGSIAVDSKCSASRSIDPRQSYLDFADSCMDLALSGGLIPCPRPESDFEISKPVGEELAGFCLRDGLSRPMVSFEQWPSVDALPEPTWLTSAYLRTTVLQV